MHNFYHLLFAIAVFCCPAFAQTRVFDAAVLNLQGPVKEAYCATSSEIEHLYEFTEDGTLVDAKEMFGEIEHNRNGYIAKTIKDSSKSYLLSLLAGSNTSPDTTSYSYLNGKITLSESPHGRICKYIYNDKGDLTEMTETTNGKITLHYKYSEIETDCFGNWIWRKATDMISNNSGYEVREISYWTDCSQAAAAQQAQGKFAEPDRELAINDILHKVLGVIDVANGDIWSLSYQQVLNEAKLRTNWEVTSTGYFTGIYGNSNYGEKKAIGYNLTYHGEPLFSVGFKPDYKKSEIECLSFSFQRDIKGSKANSTHRKNALTWASDNDAKAFANIIVAELEAETGLKMQKIKNLKGDIYTMAAYDNRTFYKVRVFKQSDEYSAFYMASLEMYKSGSKYNTLRK